MPSEEIRIEVSGDNHGVIIAGDNNTVNQIKAPFRLTRLPPRRALPAGSGPAALLSAHYELAPFVDCPERAALSGWLEDGSRFGALLMSAPGGYGKTRLGIEVCRRAAAAGWRVLLAGNSLDLSMFEDGQALEHHGQPVRGTLVFVDYADRWPPSARILRTCGHRWPASASTTSAERRAARSKGLGTTSRRPNSPIRPFGCVAAWSRTFHAS